MNQFIGMSGLVPAPYFLFAPDLWCKPLTSSSVDRPLSRRPRLQPSALRAQLQPRDLGRVGHRSELEDAGAARLRHALRRTARWGEDFQTAGGARQGVWEERRGG